MADQASPPYYEYHVETFERGSLDAVGYAVSEYANQQAAQGWRLLACGLTAEGDGAIMVLERRRQANEGG